MTDRIPLQIGVAWISLLSAFTHTLRESIARSGMCSAATFSRDSDTGAAAETAAVKDTERHQGS